MTTVTVNAATVRHIELVRKLLRIAANELMARGEEHDQSKLVDPEAGTFDEFSPKLSAVTYGSDEYKSFLAAMKPALDHHYAMNRHHPEHFENGVNGMNLIDLLEMFIDWCAASQRHNDGNIHRSIASNLKRFELSPQLAQIFHNTAHDLNETLGMPDEYRGCCARCANGNWPDGKGVQCALTSERMWNHDTCEAFGKASTE